MKATILKIFTFTTALVLASTAIAASSSLGANNKKLILSYDSIGKLGLNDATKICKDRFSTKVKGKYVSYGYFWSKSTGYKAISARYAQRICYGQCAGPMYDYKHYECVR